MVAPLFVLLLSMAMASEGPVPAPTAPPADEVWAGIYVRATRTANAGAAMPLVAAILAGPLLLSGGTTRACAALHRLRIDVNCTAGRVTWAAAPVLLVAASLSRGAGAPASLSNGLAITAFPAAFATGYLQMGLNNFGWNHGTPRRLAVLPEVRKDYAGARWAIEI